MQMEHLDLFVGIDPCRWYHSHASGRTSSEVAVKLQIDRLIHTPRGRFMVLDGGVWSIAPTSVTP